MTRRRPRTDDCWTTMLPVVLVATLTVSLSGCGDSRSSQQSATSGTPHSPITAVQSTSTAPAVPTTLGGLSGSASKQACLQDARLVQQASDVFVAKHGQAAASMDALVADGELRAVPSTDHGYVITYDAAVGKVTAAGACEVS
jgi:hypothetical protein